MSQLTNLFESSTMADRVRLLEAMGRELARRNPAGAEVMGKAMLAGARAETTPRGLGVATGINLLIHNLEMRAGELDRYIDGAAPGDGYVEVIIPLG